MTKPMLETKQSRQRIDSIWTCKEIANRKKANKRRKEGKTNTETAAGYTKERKKVIVLGKKRDYIMVEN